MNNVILNADTTDAIEITALIVCLMATVFSGWMFKKAMEYRVSAGDDAYLLQLADRRLTVSLFHFTKPLLLSVSFFWCLFLNEGALQAAVKNGAVTSVCVLMLLRSLYEWADGPTPWAWLDRRSKPRQQPPKEAQ